MANTEGGAILLGAKERADGSLSVFGIENPEKLETELWNLLQKDAPGFLVAVGAAREPRGQQTVLQPTWAGLWMLGEETAIRELLPHWHLSYKEIPEDPEDPQRWLDRVHPDGSWNANVFEFYLRVIVKLHEGLKVPFKMSEGQFRVDETPVHDALREALVNALVHADYQGTTGVRVLSRRVGFELINLGYC